MSLWLEPAVFPVLLDSCVLYPYGLRDLLLEIAHEHLYGVHRSPQILEDTVHNLLADARTTPERASRFCSATKRAFPEALVEPPSGLADELGCDPGDRHVLAAAIAAKAELIVTLNASGMGLRFWCLNFGKRWMVAPTGVHRAGGGAVDRASPPGASEPRHPRITPAVGGDSASTELYWIQTMAKARHFGPLVVCAGAGPVAYSGQ